MKPRETLTRFWPLLFLLTGIEALGGALILASVPAEGEGAFLGYSLARWGVMLPLLLIAGTGMAAGWVTHRYPGLRETWLSPAVHPARFRWLGYAFTLLGVTFAVGMYLLRWSDPERLLIYYLRAWPLLAFLTLACLQLALWLVLLRFGLRRPVLESWKPAGIALLILGLVYAFAAVTGLGLTPDRAYWGEPGVPILGWQLLLIALLGGLYFLFVPAAGGRRSLLWPAWAPGLLIFLAACAVWLSVPNSVLRNSFYFPIDPPANIPFPHSDSGYYDYMAQSLLIGTGYTGTIPTRPLYIVFLTGLHVLLGERYDLIALAQTAPLALFPVTLYWLGSKIHSRTAGLTIAMLAIAREWTSLVVSSDTRVSNTRMLLVDVPTLLLILLACASAFRWLERRDHLGALVAGGAFGILLLLRTQAMLILPFALLVVVFAYRGAGKAWGSALLVFVAGLAASIAPWLTHNYLEIGRFSFDAPFQLQVLASQYAYTGNLDYASVDLEGKGLLGILVTFALKDPGFVAGFISNHFLATQVSALLALPLIAPFEGLSAPIHLYWTSFSGQLAWYNQALLAVYLVVIAIGLGAAWTRWRWTGLLPLAFNLGYALANGVARFSGWRYNLPADWIAYFYLGIGFAAILVWIASAFGVRTRAAATPSTPGGPGSPLALRTGLGIALAFSLLGSAPWLAKLLSPPPPPVMSTAEVASTLEAFTAPGVTAEEIGSFALQPEAVGLNGRVLYPRFFWRESGISSATPWQAYLPRAYPRLGFLLINRNVREVVLPLKGAQVDNIHALPVLVLGCDRGSYVEARLVLVQDPGHEQAILSHFGLQPCAP